MISWMWLVPMAVLIFAAYQFGQAKGIDWCTKQIDRKN